MCPSTAIIVVVIIIDVTTGLEHNIIVLRNQNMYAARQHVPCPLQQPVTRRFSSY